MALRTFPSFPEESECLICKKNTNKECFLMPIQGTEKGNIMEATPVHVDCVRMTTFIEGMVFSPELNLVYVPFPLPEDSNGKDG